MKVSNEIGNGLDYVDVTFDVQYETDRMDKPRGELRAWIIGGRLNFDF